jgi:prepilin peptidase CpaA
MNMITTISAVAAAVAFLLFVFAMLYAAVSDLTTYKIRNNIVLTLLLAYLVFAPIVGFTSHEIWRSFAVAGIVLICTFGLFTAGLIGGGDAKLAAVTALWLGADHTLAYLLLLALVGGVFAIFVALWRMWPLPEGLARKAWITQLHSRGERARLPYGVAITLAALCVLPSTPWMI